MEQKPQPTGDVGENSSRAQPTGKALSTQLSCGFAKTMIFFLVTQASSVKGVPRFRKLHVAGHDLENESTV